jgi:uncharacterized protein YijF (DUF1287 family)
MSREALFFLPLLVLAGCGQDKPRPRAGPAPEPAASPAPQRAELSKPEPKTVPVPPARPSAPRRRAAPRGDGTAGRIVARARAEVTKKAGYSAKYHAIAYPGGDVPGGGVCTDLVVRAYRAAGHDFQKLVHEDMTANFAKYPDNWGLTATDPNIDHRRVPNLMCFLRRKGRWMSTSAQKAELVTWKPGDVVFWELGSGGRRHCGIISDRKDRSGRPLVIHNLGGAAENDCLTKWKILGHARYPRGPESPGAARTARKAPPAPPEDDDEPKG